MHSNSKEELTALYAQIEQIYTSFRTIRGEAEGILETSDMPDSKSQLGDVLQSTEAATMAIINHVSAIQEIVGESAIGEAAKTEVQQHVMQVFEACSFQDISGQRIQKVMARLQALEDQLMRLSSAARNNDKATDDKPRDQLLNGPQLSGKAPDQAEIDRMFNSDS